MKEMTIAEFHDVIATYIAQVAKETDLSDPDTIVFTPEFDDMLRHIKSKPSAKMKTVYLREDAHIRLLYRQLLHKINNKNGIKIL